MMSLQTKSIFRAVTLIPGIVSAVTVTVLVSLQPASAQPASQGNISAKRVEPGMVEAFADKAPTSRQATKRPRSDYYFSNTEVLGEDEMRIIALGTGSPFVRKSQASASWLVELGNGDSFIFDLGTGAVGSFHSLEIPYQKITAVFLSHLHVDHVGDFAAYWVAGWGGGRMRPLRVWGPSGLKPELGTKHFVDKLLEAYTWDAASRHGKLPAAGAVVEVHEFDYSQVQTVYEQNGVKIISYPAIHALDGPVSFRLEWNGLSFVYSGDTAASRTFIENSKNADVLVHEVFPPPSVFAARTGMDLRTAYLVSTTLHTPATIAGKIFSLTAPRLAVGYHFPEDVLTSADVAAGIRTTYDGPFVQATDLMVFNVTPKSISIRTAAGVEKPWPAAGNVDRSAYASAKRKPSIPISDWLEKTRLEPLNPPPGAGPRKP